MPFPPSLRELFENNAPYKDFAALFERSPDFIQSQDDSGETPLHYAARDNRADLLAFLLAQGADKDSTAIDGVRPLLIAAHNGHIEIVNALLQAGADKDKEEDGGFTPIFAAAQNGHIKVVDALLEAHADINKAVDDLGGATPIFAAAQNGHTEVVDALLEAGADKDKARDDGATPLLIAAQKGLIEVTDALLEAGANIHLRWKTKDRTPLLAAALGNNKKCFELLLEHPEVTTSMLADIIITMDVSDAFRMQAITELEKRLAFASDETKRAWPKCPLTQTFILEPVIGTDGCCYEKSYITKWLSEHNASPHNRQPMTVNNLIKPHYLADWIEGTFKQLDDAFFASRTTPMDLSSDAPMIKEDLANHRARFFENKRKQNQRDNRQETARNEYKRPRQD